MKSRAIRNSVPAIREFNLHAKPLLETMNKNCTNLMWQENKIYLEVELNARFYWLNNNN